MKYESINLKRKKYLDLVLAICFLFIAIPRFGKHTQIPIYILLICSTYFFIVFIKAIVTEYKSKEKVKIGMTLHKCIKTIW